MYNTYHIVSWWPGGLSIRKWSKSFTPQPSHFHKKVESHHWPCSIFAIPMMVLYRKWASDLGAKWPRPTLRGSFAKWLWEKAWIYSQLSYWKTPHTEWLSPYAIGEDNRSKISFTTSSLSSCPQNILKLKHRSQNAQTFRVWYCSWMNYGTPLFQKN